MILKEKTIQGSKINELNLFISNSKKDVIEVSRGEFIISGVEYGFDDDVYYTVVGHEESETDIRGFLTLNPDGFVELVIDEFNRNGTDVPFTFNGSGYRLLSKLFSCRIPQGSVDLSNVSVEIWKIIPLEEKEKKPRLRRVKKGRE